MSSPIEGKSRPDVTGLIRQFIVPILCFLAVVGTWMYTSGIKGDHADRLSANQETIASLKNQADVKNLAAQNKTVVLNSELSGANDKQKADDDAAFKRLMGSATTWTSYKEYMDARAKIKTTYHMSENDQFLKTFMPSFKAITDRSGKNYNLIDTNGYNVRFEGMTSTLTNVKPNSYQYFAVVTVSSQASKTNDRAETHDVVTYTTDGKHHITNVNVSKITGQIYSSGSMG